MRRRRYLRAAGAAGAIGLAGCSALPFDFGSGSPLRGLHERARPVVSLAAGPDGVYAADVPASGETLLVGLSLRSVDTRWERRLLTDGSALEMWRDGDRLLAMNGDSLIVTEAGFSTETWRRGGATVPIVTDDTAFLRSVRDVTYIEGLDLASGSIEWSVELDGTTSIPSTRAPRALAGDRLVTSDTRQPLRTRATSDGTVLWETETTFGVRVAATEDAIYGIEDPRSSHSVVHRVDPGDGASTETWAGPPRRLNLAVTTESVVVFSAGDEPGLLAGLDPETLAERWRVEGIHTWPEWLGPETVLALDADEGVVELDPSTGDRLWSRPLEHASVPVVAWTDTIVAIATASAIECRTRADGQRRWQFSVPESDTDSPVSITTTPGTIGYASGETVRVFETQG